MSRLMEAMMITRRPVKPSSLEQQLDLIRREFCALPGLRLTAAQCQRMWDLAPRESLELLERLVEARFLVRKTDGTFMRADVEPLLTLVLPPAAGTRAPRNVA